MKHITTDELKRLPVTEGLVLQGCGGDPDEWLAGINDLLTEADILRDGDTFKDAYVFEHDGHTNILFSMEDVKLDIGKLTIWRLQTHDNFGGTWLSDYIPNRLGVEWNNRETDRRGTASDSPISTPQPEPTADSYHPAFKVDIVNADDMASMLGDINRMKDGGSFAGKWHSFPTTAEELKATLKEIGVDGVKHRAYGLNDFDGVSNALYAALLMFTDLDELNYLALKLSGLTEYQREIFEAVLESNQHCGSVADVINLTENLGRFDIQPTFSPEEYGAYQVELARNEYADIMNRLETSTDPAERDFFNYIAGIEMHIDLEAYGMWIEENENGVFTERGYLTASAGFQEFYKGKEDIPAEYRVFAYPENEPLMKVENIDLCDFVLKTHALAGEYMTDANYHLNMLADKISSEYLMLMDGCHIFLAEAAHAYQRDTEAFDIFMSASEDPDTRIFAIHVTDMDNGPLCGDVVEVNCAERQLDILQNSIQFTRVDATPKYGPNQSFTPEEWDRLEAIDWHMIQSWTRHFDSGDQQAVIRHLDDLRGKDDQTGEAVAPDVLLADLNRRYMEKSQNPQPDMLRVTQAAAKEMLARGDTDVYRLLPGGAEKLHPIDAVKNNGLWYQQYREFAVKREDTAGMDKWAKRETDARVRRQPDRSTPDKLKNPDQEL